MLRNYLKTAFRNLRRYPGYTAINLLGLSIGLTVCLLITSFIFHELSFENCHSKKDRIYRVQLNYKFDDGEIMQLAGAARPLGPALKEACSDIEGIARFYRANRIRVGINTTIKKNQTILAVEPDFFNVFDVNVLRGNPQADLTSPNTIYLTERLAKFLFGREDPIGKTVSIEKQVQCQVAGILKDFPTNTTINCDAMVSYSSLSSFDQDVSDWSAVWTDYLYVLLRPSSNIASVEKILPPILKSNLSEKQQAMMNYEIKPFGDLYFNPRPANELSPSGNESNLILFSIVALVTLVIACINFINHLTARISNRIKELSVRTIIGASRLELVRQLLCESLLITTLASVIAASAFEILRPALISYIGRDVSIGLINQPLMIAAVFVLPILVVLTAGIYPALYLSRYRTVYVLKGNAGINSRKSFTRRALVIFQFTAAIILTAVTSVVLSQIKFSYTWDKGFDDKNVVIVEADDNLPASLVYQLKHEITRDPGVLGVAACNTLTGTNFVAASGFQALDRPDNKKVDIRLFHVDPDFTSVLNIGLEKGRYLSTDDINSNGTNILINQKAVKELGLNEPVGAKLLSHGSQYTIVGVLKDFHSVPTFSSDWSVMLYVDNEVYHYLLIKVKPENAGETINRVKTIWNKTVPDQPFEYSYFDQKLVQQYNEHFKFGNVLGMFSLIALVIAGLGVFSLASYATERRRREIGIRKVVGASVTSVVKLLGSEFVVLVLIASVIGSPIAWYLSNRWLERFVNRIDIGIGLFLFAGIVSMIVTVASVSFQALKAALANPVDSLKNE